MFNACDCCHCSTVREDVEKNHVNQFYCSSPARPLLLSYPFRVVRSTVNTRNSTGNFESAVLRLARY